MGGTTIRRQIGHEDFTASVQRFVIQPMGANLVVVIYIVIEYDMFAANPILHW